MKKIYKIKVENKTYEVEVEEVNEVAGSVVSSGVQTPAPAAAPVAVSGDSAKVVAPMPGVLIDIKVNVGDTVAKGQVVAVLEAMKMETEILSDVDGKVTAVNASKGANVNHDDLILTIN